MQYRLGIDLGGTSIKAGVVDERDQLISSYTAPTPRDFDRAVSAMAKTARIAAEKAGLTFTDFPSIGVGSPSFVNPETGLLVFFSNLNWRNKPLKKELENLIPLPVYIENDANCAVIGEMYAGAAKGCKNVLLLTLGTGVGGGAIVDGRLFTGGDGMGAEFGHTPLIAEGELCACGMRGCLEAYASVTALIRQTEKAMTAHPESRMHAHAKAHGGRVSGRTAFDCADEGDDTALAVVEQYCTYLAMGIGGFITLFRPEVVLIGGGLSGAGDTLLVPVRQKVPLYVHASDIIGVPPIKKAALGNAAGVIGAAHLGDLKRPHKKGLNLQKDEHT